MAASEWKIGRVAGFRRVLTRKTWAHARQAGMGRKHFEVVGYKQAGCEAAESKAHAERFGIFFGLWAPTFFALSGRLEGYSEIPKNQGD